VTVLNTIKNVKYKTQIIEEISFPSLTAGRIIQQDRRPQLPTQWHNPQSEEVVMSAILLREHFNKNHLEDHKQSCKQLDVTVATGGNYLKALMVNCVVN